MFPVVIVIVIAISFELSFLLVFRFSNSLLEPIWNRNHVSSVQVTMSERIGVEGRGAFYDGVGNRPHDPTVCYPAQGWDVVGLRDRALPLPGGEELLGHFLRATQGPSEELVLYWFQPPERWPASTKLEPWLRALDGLAGRSRYAFIRLSTRVTAPESAAGGALRAIAGLPIICPSNLATRVHTRDNQPDGNRT